MQTHVASGFTGKRGSVFLVALEVVYVTAAILCVLGVAVLGCLLFAGAVGSEETARRSGLLLCVSLLPAVAVGRVNGRGVETPVQPVERGAGRGSGAARIVRARSGGSLRRSIKLTLPTSSPTARRP